MALDMLSEIQEDTCALYKTECCVYLPDNSHNVFLAMYKIQIIDIDILSVALEYSL
jgi:hypothetical protein